MTHLDPKALEALSTALDSIETGPDPEAGLARAREIVAGFASPTPAVSREVTDEQLAVALKASADQYEVARNLQASSPKSYAECFGEATPPELAMRAALTAALSSESHHG